MSYMTGLSSADTIGDAFASQPDSLVEKFFKQTTVPRQNETVAILTKLEAMGYVLDQTMVISGANGEKWPQLLRPGFGTTISGVAITRDGSSSSNSSSPVTLIEYLNKLLNPQQNVPNLPSVFAQHSYLPPNQAMGSWNLASLWAAGQGTVTINAPTWSLEKLRNLGIFTGAIPKQENTLTTKELLRAKLFITHDGRFLIMKDKKIVACSPNLKILEMNEYGLYVQSKNSSSDCPILHEEVKLTLPLNDATNVSTFLPYIQGIPLQ